MTRQYRLTSTSKLVLPKTLEELYELFARLVHDYNNQLYVDVKQTQMIPDVEIRLLQLKYAPGILRVIQTAVRHEHFGEWDHERAKQEFITHLLWWNALKEELKELGMWVRIPDEND